MYFGGEKSLRGKIVPSFTKCTRRFLDLQLTFGLQKHDILLSSNHSII